MTSRKTITLNLLIFQWFHAVVRSFSFTLEPVRCEGSIDIFIFYQGRLGTLFGRGRKRTNHEGS